MGEISVLNADGNRYVYGIPIYNRTQREVVFSRHHGSEYNNDSRSEYDDDDVTLDNDEGSDNYYSSTSFEEYAHSYLLTAVLGADYVDLTGDGPSDDDLGYFVKFNYFSVY